MTNVPLTGLTADITLPSGINAKVYDCELEEDFREKDSEGFIDQGYGSGTLTGQRIKGSVLGWLTGDAPGVGSLHEAVPITFIAASGCEISGNFNITRFRIRMKVGELSIFTAEVASVGTYSVAWTNS